MERGTGFRKNVKETTGLVLHQVVSLFRKHYTANLTSKGWLRLHQNGGRFKLHYLALRYLKN